MIYKKSKQEIEDKKAQNRFYANMVKGISDPVCEYYCINKKGEKVDVWDMSTYDIIGYILSHKAEKKDAWKIFDYMKDNQFICDFSTLKSVMELEKQYGHIIRDILGKLDEKGLYAQASTIAQYKTEVEGKKTTPEQIMDNYIALENKKKAEKNASV